MILYLIAFWKIFTKAGRKGWEGIIPIYNFFILLKIVGKPWYWFLLMCIPFLNIIWAIWMVNMLSKSFGKDEGFTVGLLLVGFVFYPILAFSKSIQYQGPFGDAQAFRDYQASKRPTFDFESASPNQ